MDNFLGSIFFVIVVSLPIYLFIKLSDLSDYIFKSKIDKSDNID